MTGDDGDDLENELLREQYVSLRDEAIGRIRARRQLIAAALAFFAAFLGYAFAVSGGGGENGSFNRPNVWLLVIIPPLIAFLAFEIFRSESQLKRINDHLSKIERRALADADEYGWETRTGGGSYLLRILVIALIAIIYIITSIIGYKSWSSAPLNNITFTTLLPDSGSEWILLGFYLITGGGTLLLISRFLGDDDDIILISRFLGDDNESDGVLFDNFDKITLKKSELIYKNLYRDGVRDRIDTLEDEVEALKKHDKDLYNELQSTICTDDAAENGGDGENDPSDGPD